MAKTKAVGKVTQDFRDGSIEVTFTDWDEVRRVELMHAEGMQYVPDLTGALVRETAENYSIAVPSQKHCATCRCTEGELVFV